MAEGPKKMGPGVLHSGGKEAQRFVEIVHLSQNADRSDDHEDIC